MNVAQLLFWTITAVTAFLVTLAVVFLLALLISRLIFWLDERS